MARFTLTVSAKTDDLSNAVELEEIIRKIAPFVVDNVVIGAEVHDAQE